MVGGRGNFPGSNFPGWHFFGGNYPGGNFSRGHLSGGNFLERGAIFSGAFFPEAFYSDTVSWTYFLEVIRQLFCRGVNLNYVFFFLNRDIIWCMESQTRLFVCYVSFFQITLLGCAFKAENWHALSHEQYFSKHRFLDICQCAFKDTMKHLYGAMWKNN